LIRASSPDGIESVPQAPAELRAFIATLPMVPTPQEWNIIEQGGAAVAPAGIT
jgi:hypothetical protein